VWQVGSGSLVQVGIDEVVGGDRSARLSDRLLLFFHSRGYSTLDHFCTKSTDRRFYWLGHEFFHLEEPLKREWLDYLMVLNR